MSHHFSYVISQMCRCAAENCAQPCKITDAPRSESKCPSNGPHLSVAHSSHSSSQSSLRPDEIRFFLLHYFHVSFSIQTVWMSIFSFLKNKNFFTSWICFSNSDILQSTYNVAPILETDPCVHYNMKSLRQSSTPQYTGVHEFINIRIYIAVPSCHLSNKGRD